MWINKCALEIGIRNKVCLRKCCRDLGLRGWVCLLCEPTKKNKNNKRGGERRRERERERESCQLFGVERFGLLILLTQ